jgi:hypothetical protein
VAQRLEDLDDEATYILHFIPSETRLLRVSVEGGLPARLPIATAVPAISLLDAFLVQFELPEGHWELQLDGLLLDPFEILADRVLTSESVLSLRRIV